MDTAMDTEPDEPADAKSTTEELFRQFVTLSERKRELSSEMGKLGDQMKTITGLVQDELKRSSDGCAQVDGARVRLRKRTNKGRLSRVHLIKCTGMFVLGKKIVSTNSRAREMAIALTDFVYSSLPEQESWSVSVSSPPTASSSGLTQREAQLVCNLDFAAMLNKLRPIKRAV
jgi:hypothetical protein